MTWEAFRLTSKSPSDLYRVLGPQAVDELIRHAINSCWRLVPEDQRTFNTVLKHVHQVFNRNLAVWTKIKKPTPAAFFQDLHPDEADGLFRQALVLCWMMLPRAGGRKFSEVHKIVRVIFDRNLIAWNLDNRTFTHAPAKRPAKPKPKPKRKSKSRR